jgi:hypothetical protein
MSKFTLTSSAFSEGDSIPLTYTCEGKNINPPLSISDTPENTMSLAIVVEDPDIPAKVKEKMKITVFDHWVAYNIPPSTKDISADDPIGTQGSNSSGEVGYTGPCPPAAYEPVEHRYVFTVYALDTTFDLPEGATKEELLKAMNKHIVSTAKLIGQYRMQADT